MDPLRMRDSGSSEPDEIMAAFRSRHWEPERDHAPWFLAIGVVASVLGLAWLNLRPIDEPTGLGRLERQEMIRAEPTAEPMPSQTLRPDVISAAPQARPGAVRVYECTASGQKVISDRPCGSGAVERMIDTRALNTYQETPVRIATAPSPRQRPPAVVLTQAPSQPTQSSKDSLCEQLQARIDYINAQTRQKHTSRQGEYWRAEWHKAKNAYYDARCGR